MPQRTSPRSIVFLGAPGTGKGTQAAFLAKELQLCSVSTGEMLRTEAKSNTSAGLQLRQMLATGSLVPDQMVCDILSSRVRAASSGNGYVFDGFPRTVAQAEFLDDLLRDAGLPRPTVVHLRAAKGVLLKRLTSRRQCVKCGAIYNLISRPSKKGRLCEIDLAALVQRDDDTEGVILRRMAEYEAVSLALHEYYSSSNYHVVDVARDADEVSRDLLSSICVSVMAA